MRYFFFMVIALLLLGLCNCNKKQRGTFTIKGRLMKDCGGQPLEGRRVSARESIQSGHGAEEIGSAVTDAEGYFELVCGYYSAAPKEVQGLPGEYETPQMTESGQIIDLGTIYANYVESIVIKINVLSNAYTNDTLFVKGYGYGNNQVDTIYPILQGVQYYVYANSYDDSQGLARRIGNDTHNMRYSVGISEINAFREDAAYQTNYCGMSKDTVTITLP